MVELSSTRKYYLTNDFRPLYIFVISYLFNLKDVENYHLMIKSWLASLSLFNFNPYFLHYQSLHSRNYTGHFKDLHLAKDTCYPFKSELKYNCAWVDCCCCSRFGLSLFWRYHGYCCCFHHGSQDSAANLGVENY